MNTKTEEKTGEQPLTVSPVIDKSLVAKAATAHSRINISVNVNNWKHLDQEVQDELLWFHQYILDKQFSWDDVEKTLTHVINGKAVNYNRTTIFKILRGMYEGSWSNIISAIKSFRKLEHDRGSIQKNEFVENGISKLIWAGLDYAIANNSITTIIGESRMGKTEAGKAWRDAHNHGRSVYIEAPPIGGAQAFLRAFANTNGGNKSLSSTQMLDEVLRAYNKNRILLVDEAHRLLPSDRNATPICLEILRHIHDRTGAAIALFATQRFEDSLKASHYQFEQILGRIGMPIRLPKKIAWKDVAPIVHQFVKGVSGSLQEQLMVIANNAGRLGILVETLKVASRMANKRKEKLTEQHIISAIALRAQMMGGAIAQSKEEGK